MVQFISHMTGSLRRMRQRKNLLLITVVAFFLTIQVMPSIVYASEPSVSYYNLVTLYSPVIVQEVGCCHFNDYITRFDYDGDYVGGNNWDNLANFIYDDNGTLIEIEKARPLPAYVYYAIQETNTHYFIWYALFHPVDDFCRPSDSHENDLEGMVLTVKKDGTLYGDLRMVQLQAHSDFYQWWPIGETGIIDGDDNLDGRIELRENTHPVVYVEGGGHGLRSVPTGELTVTYYFLGNAQDPDDVGWGYVGYDLLSLQSELWERRMNCCGLGFLLDNQGYYTRYGFSIGPFGKNFDGNEGSDDAAGVPWNWDDDDDGGWWMPGDWFMHPAAYHSYRLYWEEPFSTTYLFHPIGYEHLGGDIYNGNQGTTFFNNGPYHAVFDITVPNGQTVNITQEVNIRFETHTKIVSNGVVTATGGTQYPTRLTNVANTIGINMSGGSSLRMKNGGALWLA